MSCQVRACNLVPAAPRGAYATYERLGPDDAAAALGHELSDRGRSPTSWLRDLKDGRLPPGALPDARAEEMHILGNSYSPLMLDANLSELLSPTATVASLQLGPARPLWSLCSGMGSELAALKAAGARLSTIYAVDKSPAALATCARNAKNSFPSARLVLDGDFLDPTTRDRWSESAIFARLDAEGVPLIFCGWPCLGHAGARRQSHDEECFDNPSSAMLLVVARIIDTVLTWLAAN